ncbi:MAG: hypothetical protein SPK09_06170 [Porphyromonas sp.]|nr:hypothetical protein [Porphyromonas sp.]
MSDSKKSTNWSGILKVAATVLTIAGAVIEGAKQINSNNQNK